MASKGANNDVTGILLDFKEDLIDTLALTDLEKFSTELLRNRVISGEKKEKFDSLDQHHLDSKLLVRYLLKVVFSMIANDSSLLQLFLRALSSLGGNGKQICGLICEKVDRLLSTEDTGLQHGDSKKVNTSFTEEDAQFLTDILAHIRDKWSKVGIALGLSRAQRNDCKEEDSISSLNNVLCEWIAQKPEQANMKTLKEKLAGNIVGEGRTAMELEEKFLKAKQPETVLESKIPSLSSALCVVYQSSHTEVADTKSTLLEVQVSPSESVSYQWTKNSKPLEEDDNYVGVHSDILFVHHASQGVEGKYQCHVSKENEKACSYEVNLTVIFSPAKQHLLNLYSKYKHIPADTLLPIGTSGFIDLALIRSSKFCTKKTDYSLEGSADDAIADEEIVDEGLLYQYRSGSLLIVEGRPGSGKSTFARKIVLDWHKGRALKGARITFFIPIRLLTMNANEDDLVGVLSSLYYQEKPDLLTREMESIYQGDGEGVCFIIDGLDEYYPQNPRKSIIYKLLYKTRLPQSMVIVLSQPSSTTDLKLKAPISECLEVVGFSKENILRYISSFPLFKDSHSSEAKLKHYLDTHENVLNMCYLPLHAAMICSLYGSDMSDIPTTETRIYEDFVKLTVLHYCKQTDKSVSFSSLAELSGNMKESFEKLCHLAFHMTVNSKPVINQNEAPSDSCPDIFFGLVTEDQVVEVSSLGTMQTWSFLHLTLQEFFAAYYVAQLEREVQLKLAKEHSEKPYLLNMWKFFFGLVNCTEPNFVEFLHYSLLKISPKEKFLTAVHFAFESQDTNACDAVMKLSTRVALESRLKASDITALSYILSASSESIFAFCLVHRCTDEDGFLKLFTSLSMPHFDSLHTLAISGVGMGSSGAMALAKAAKHFKWLRDIDLSNNNLQWSDDINTLFQGHFSYLDHINLSHNNIGDNVISLAEYCGEKVTENCVGKLESLNLSYNRISSGIVKDLYCTFKLFTKAIYLEGNSCISWKEIEAIASKYKVKNKLKKIHLTFSGDSNEDISKDFHEFDVPHVSFILHERRFSFSGFESHPEVIKLSDFFTSELNNYNITKSFVKEHTRRRGQPAVTFSIRYLKITLHQCFCSTCRQ